MILLLKFGQISLTDLTGRHSELKAIKKLNDMYYVLLSAQMSSDPHNDNNCLINSLQHYAAIDQPVHNLASNTWTIHDHFNG